MGLSLGVLGNPSLNIFLITIVLISILLGHSYCIHYFEFPFLMCPQLAPCHLGARSLTEVFFAMPLICGFYK